MLLLPLVGLASDSGKDERILAPEDARQRGFRRADCGGITVGLRTAFWLEAQCVRMHVGPLRP